VLCRDSGVILLASGGAGSELLSIWGRPSSCTSKPTLSYAKSYAHPVNACDIATPCCRSLGTRHIATSLLGEKPSFSACCVCHCCWLGSDLLHEAALLWASPREIVSSACYSYVMAVPVCAVSTLNSLCRCRCQSRGLTACSQECALCLRTSKLGMLGSSQESDKQTTRSLTGQLKASCGLLCTVASASGRTCHSEHRGESCQCEAS